MKEYRFTCDECGASSPPYKMPQAVSQIADRHLCSEVCASCGYRRRLRGHRGLCSACYKTDARHDQPNQRGVPKEILVADAEWMADDGNNLTGACARLNIKPDTLWQACKRANRKDVYNRLADREPDADVRKKLRKT